MILTTWGYTLTDADSLPDIVDVATFDTMTAGKYKGDVRTASELRSAQGAVRNYVGWHLAGNLACKCELPRADNSVVLSGADIIVQLPARYVTDVTSVTVAGSSADNYDLQTNGILRIYDAAHMLTHRWSKIVVEYNAGLTDEMADAVKEVICHRVTHALANSYGIQSESSGGVSVTYSANWINTARATALPDDNKEVLNPYRLQGVF